MGNVWKSHGKSLFDLVFFMGNQVWYITTWWWFSNLFSVSGNPWINPTATLEDFPRIHSATRKKHPRLGQAGLEKISTFSRFKSPLKWAIFMGFLWASWALKPPSIWLGSGVLPGMAREKMNEWIGSGFCSCFWTAVTGKCDLTEKNYGKVNQQKRIRNGDWPHNWEYEPTKHMDMIPIIMAMDPLKI